MRSRWSLTMLLVLMVGLAFPFRSSWSAPEGDEQFYESLAIHYAPVVRQGVVSEQDYITALDFDGDWIGNNNWENMPHFEIRAYVYYSVIESKTHWFIFYSLFHPRDYTLEDCAISGGCHENDLESIQLTVEKDGTLFGKPKALETLAHDSIYLYIFDKSVGSGFLRVTGIAELEDGHPLIYVEALGHGIYGHIGIASAMVGHLIDPSNTESTCCRRPSMATLSAKTVRTRRGDTGRRQEPRFPGEIGSLIQLEQ